MNEYPEHDKLKAIAVESEVIGRFLESSGFVLAEYGDVEGFAESRLLPVQYCTDQVLADYFKIDLPALGREKVRMLDDLLLEMNRLTAGANNDEGDNRQGGA
jgi:hypothetical protein